MEIVTKIAPLGLAIIMLGLGMSLTIKDFTRVVKFPKDFLVGLICQMLVLPIIAFALIKLLNTPLELALGVMIIAAAPGGVTSNVLTKFADGDVALSITLTAIISLVSIISVPFIIFLSIDLLNINYLKMEIVTKIAPLGLAIIMLGLGMSLTIKDFTRVVKFPKDFLVGLICQMLVLPIIAFALIKLLNTPLELALGVMIIAAAPGGVTSNVLTKFADGDVALSITLTAIISLVSIISVPFIIFLSIDLLNINYITKEFSMVGISLKMFFVVTVPVLIGMIIRHFAENLILNNVLLIQRISIALFVLVFIAIYIEEWDNIASFIKQAGLIALILNIVMMIVGFYVAKFFTSGVAQQRCISLECGLQNGTLAVFVSTQLFDEMVYIVPTAAYALVMMATSLFFVYIVKKSS